MARSALATMTAALAASAAFAAETGCDDADGALAASGFTCASAAAAVLNDCTFDMGHSGLMGFGAGQMLSEICPAYCGIGCDAPAAQTGTGFYAMSAIDIEGNTVEFSQYQGTVSLVVNVAQF
jgi:hypothetical protein